MQESGGIFNNFIEKNGSLKSEIENIPVTFLRQGTKDDETQQEDDVSAIELSQKSVDLDFMQDILKRTFKENLKGIKKTR